MEDFIQYYKTLGLCAIYIYDNADREEEKLTRFARNEENFQVVVIPFPGQAMQIKA
jgi:hypothetical protein